MTTRDIFADLGRLNHPLPEHPGEGADEIELDVWNDAAWESDRQRREYEEELRQTFDVAPQPYDPLIDELMRTRAEIRAAEERLRLLIAYGREFVEPRPYTLHALAQAAGMSVSGVRTAYDDDHINDVRKRIGARLRCREDTEPASEPAGTEPATGNG